MISKSIALVVGILLLGTAVSTQTWSSWWSDTTRYDGARTLRNRSYKALEIHGAATLDHVTVEKSLMVTGSTEIEDSTIQGKTTIMGVLQAKSCMLGGNVDIKGGLVAEGLEVKGNLTVSGSTKIEDATIQGSTTIMASLEAKGACVLGGRADIKGSLTAEGLQAKGTLIVGGSIDATNSQFGAISAKSNHNQTYAFTKSNADSLTIDGLGAKRVTLKDSHIDAVEFEAEEGTVVLKGSATVGEVINGKVQKK